MEIKVLGPGCMKCNKLYAAAEEAIASSGAAVNLAKVDKLDQIMSYGVMMTPALVINGKVKCMGKVPNVAEITSWIFSEMEEKS
jgi:small redox-active disulfide protein 2